ncbi:MAG: hypothetical protein EA442_05270, partial [Candidatus Nitrosopelagicus sp.]
MVVISILISVSSPQVFAQFSSLEKDNMLVITKSDEISDVILDGRWTSITEWKHSTLSKFQYDDDKKIILKSAHSGNYIYILIDFIGDHTLDNMSDKATICFDSKNNKSKLPDNNDYCFSVALGQKQGNVFQGGSPFPLNSYLQKIEVEDYFSASSKSKIDNKFSSMTHPVYELKIP